MDRQTKLDVLQKELSRKDLDMGCLVRIPGFTYDKFIYLNTDSISGIISVLDNNLETYSCLEITEIIGHPVILSDVLVWFGKQGIGYLLGDMIGFTVFQNPLAKEWGKEINRDLTKPYLSEQDDTVVDGLYEVYLLTKKD